MILNTGKEIAIAGFSAAFIAQILKFIVYLIKNKHINFKILSTTGGMPSSHSAAVTALTTSVGLVEGFWSTIFSVSLAFSLVVMYDAAGVRLAAGRMAATLNKLIEDIYENKGHTTTKLKELLGHTPKEVLAGAMLGVAIGMYLHYYLITH